MKNTLEKLNEVKTFLNTLLDSSNEEAIDLLVNYGEDIEETLQKAINQIILSKTNDLCIPTKQNIFDLDCKIC
jgi:hypothetical protein